MENHLYCPECEQHIPWEEKFIECPQCGKTGAWSDTEENAFGGKDHPYCDVCEVFFLSNHMPFLCPYCESPLQDEDQEQHP